MLKKLNVIKRWITSENKFSLSNIFKKMEKLKIIIHGLLLEYGIKKEDVEKFI